jgi:hypothetical protein
MIRNNSFFSATLRLRGEEKTNIYRRGAETQRFYIVVISNRCDACMDTGK